MPADDPYVDPRTGILRNRLGITDPAELARAEARLAASRETTLLRERPDLGRYDLPHLQAIHRHLFGQIYDWAGQLRTVNMTKGDTLFALAEWMNPKDADSSTTLPVTTSSPPPASSSPTSRPPPLPRRQRPHPTHLPW